MKISKKFKREIERFEISCGCKKIKRTDLGLKQFFDKESKGIIPDDPDEYYLLLLNGKKWWEWTLEFIKDRYKKGEWFGFLITFLDFQNDKSGYEQIRSRLKSEMFKRYKIFKLSDKQFNEYWDSTSFKNMKKEFCDMLND